MTLIRTTLQADTASLTRAGRIMGHAGFWVLLLSLGMLLMPGVNVGARPPLKDQDSLVYAAIRLLVTVLGLLLLIGASRRLEKRLPAMTGSALQLLLTFFVAADPWYRPTSWTWALVASLLGLTYRVWLVVPTPFGTGQCSKCGYDLAGNTSGRCPECGEPATATSGAQAERMPENSDERAE